MLLLKKVISVLVPPHFVHAHCELKVAMSLNSVEVCFLETLRACLNLSKNKAVLVIRALRLCLTALSSLRLLGWEFVVKLLRRHILEIDLGHVDCLVVRVGS